MGSVPSLGYQQAQGGAGNSTPEVHFPLQDSSKNMVGEVLQEQAPHWVGHPKARLCPGPGKVGRKGFKIQQFTRRSW